MIRILIVNALLALSFPLAATVLEIASSPEWLSLLHYSKQGEVSYSEVASPSFFLSDKGKVDPQAELDATLSRLEDIKCIFPARYLLIQKLKSEPVDFGTCSELSEWLKKYQTDSVYLHFPSNYLNNPSSVFGHLFFRLHRNNRVRLLDPTVNFAATTNSPTFSEYLLKGMTGGFAGSFSIHPYFLKQQEYKVKEDREIWSYQLLLNQNEIDRMLLHFWEIKDVHFNYYFFNQNCAYQLIGLLDAAKPSQYAREKFNKLALPVEILKHLHKKKLIKLVNYTQSFSSNFRSKVSHISDKDKDKILIISSGGVVESMSSELLSLSSEYLEHLIQKDIGDRKKTQELQHKLINAMSKKQPLFPKRKVLPAKGPEQSHNKSLVSLTRNKTNKTMVGYRFGYHDHLDDVAGFSLGQNITLLDVEYELSLDKIDSYQMVTIESLSVSDRFFKPISWRLSIRGERLPSDINKRLTHQVEFGLGKSYLFKGFLAYFMLPIGADYNKNYGFNLYVNPKIGLLYTNYSYNSLFELERRESTENQNDWFNRISWTQSFKLNASIKIHLKALAWHSKANTSENIQLSLNYNF